MILQFIICFIATLSFAVLFFRPKTPVVFLWSDWGCGLDCLFNTHAE